jgi:23S rRNA pseudouridine1911/1915/1917 synthase
VHLASLGYPIVGDTVYGAPSRPLQSLKKEAPDESPTFDRNFLHAERIRFLHPRTGEALEIRAPIPEELSAVLTRLIPLDR